MSEPGGSRRMAAYTKEGCGAGGLGGVKGEETPGRKCDVDG